MQDNNNMNTGSSNNNNNFLENFERSVERDLARLGEELYSTTNKFVMICTEKYPDSIDEYVECRKNRDQFLKQEMSNLSFRIKYIKHQTEICCDLNGVNGIIPCSETFKVNLNKSYLLTFKHIDSFNL